MLLLISVSIASWAFIFQRQKALNGARSEMKNFEDELQSIEKYSVRRGIKSSMSIYKIREATNIDAD